MLVTTNASAVQGVSAIQITVEVNAGGPVGSANQYYFMVGLPDNAVKEGFHRIETAIKNIGYQMPRLKLVINMAPANIRKAGSSFDVPVALGVMAATGQMDGSALGEYMIMGELALDGGVRPVRGALPMAIEARRLNLKGFILPVENAREAAIVNNLNVYGIGHLREAVDFFEGHTRLQPTVQDTRELFEEESGFPGLDFSDVKGQENIKRALEIAAAGGHNALLIGPPGAGKTMLAKRLPGILPPLSLREALEVTKIHSVAGLLGNHASLISSRPFRSPHHTISDVALVGGGSNPHPGEISLAHHGVLFLDELPEFKRSVLEVMRQPMEDGRVTISRAKVSVDYPASFMLISSMNPCPCGYHNHPDKACVCGAGIVKKYLNKISGPLMDRIDLHVEVTPVSYDELSSDEYKSERSEVVRERVKAARDVQAKRFEGFDRIYCNAQMPSRMVREVCQLDQASLMLLKTAMKKLQLSARAYDRILKVARTVADLAGSEGIKMEHLAEAIQYRTLDREDWSD